jgi:hypothetical protein
MYLSAAISLTFSKASGHEKAFERDDTVRRVTSSCEERILAIGEI